LASPITTGITLAGQLSKSQIAEEKKHISHNEDAKLS